MICRADAVLFTWHTVCQLDIQSFSQNVFYGSKEDLNHMKKRFRMSTVFGLFFGFLFASGTLWAGEEKPLAPEKNIGYGSEEITSEKPFASADVAFLSQYIWRGYELSKDSVVIQPAVTVGYKGFTVNVWGNLDTDMYSGVHQGNSKWNETDFTVGYDHQLGPVAAGLGFIYYALDGMPDSKEVYLSLSLETLLSPTVTFYREVSKLQGWYINLEISHSFPLPYDIGLDLAASFAYYRSDNDTIVEYHHDLTPTANRFRNFQDGLISASLSIPFWQYFTIQPTLAYSFPLSGQADNMLKFSSKDLGLSGKSSHLYGGVILSIAF